MSEAISESNKPRKAVSETSLQLFEQKIRTLSPKDLQAEWVKFLKERGFDSIYTQPGKELSVGFASSFLYHGTYGYSEKTLKTAPPEIRTLFDFFMSPKINPETRKKIEMFGKEILRRKISHEAKQKIGGIDKLLAEEAYKKLDINQRQMVKMLPGGIRYKIRLAKQFAQINQDIRGKNREGCLKTLYEIESLFIKTNKDYAKDKENGESRPLTEAFILGVRDAILKFSPNPVDADIIKAGYFFKPEDASRILKRIESTKEYTLDKNNGLYRLFAGITDIPHTYTIHYFKENTSQTAGMHYQESGDIFINKFGFWRGAEKTTFSNEIFHNIAHTQLRSEDWDKIDLSGVYNILGWKKDSNFSAMEINELLSDIASINENVSEFYEYFEDYDGDGYIKSGDNKNYHLSRMQFLRVIREVLGEKRNQEIRDTYIGKSKEKIRLSKEEEKKVQEYYLNLGRAVLMEIKTQIKKLPPEEKAQ